jgi:transcription termination/antitermination protein NusG
MTLDSTAIDNRWIALQVRGGWELRSARGLRDRGYEEFVPLYREKREWSDRIKLVDKPLFTGYVFIRFNASNRQTVVSVPGFLRFVGVGSAPLPIDDQEIDALKIACRMNVPCGPCSFLEIGEPVQITSGPLAGLTGKVVRHKSAHRIVISVSLLQMSAFVEINDTQLLGPPLHDASNRPAA